MSKRNHNLSYNKSHIDMSQAVAAHPKYGKHVDSIDFVTLNEDAISYSTITTHNGYTIVINTTEDQYGDMFNIIAYRPADDKGRQSIVKKASGPLKDAQRELYEVVDAVAHM